MNAKERETASFFGGTIIGGILVFIVCIMIYGRIYNKYEQKITSLEYEISNIKAYPIKSKLNPDTIMVIIDNTGWEIEHPYRKIDGK